MSQVYRDLAFKMIQKYSAPFAERRKILEDNPVYADEFRSEVLDPLEVDIQALIDQIATLKREKAEIVEVLQFVLKNLKSINTANKAIGQAPLELDRLEIPRLEAVLSKVSTEGK